MKNKLLAVFNNLELYVCILAFAIMLFVSTLSVIARFVFNDSIPWAEEICRWCVLWATLMGAAYVVLGGEHLTIDALFNILKNHPKIIRVVKTIIAVIWIYLCIVFIDQGWELVATTVERSTVLKVSMKIAYASLPVGFMLTLLRVVQTTVKLWIPKRDEGDQHVAENVR